jgi:hypothetical protein
MTVPESGAAKEDPDSSGPILGMKSSVQSDPKKGKSSCALVFKVPKKKEIDTKLHLPSTEKKSEFMNQCNNSSVLVGSKSTIGRSGSQDEVDQKRNSMHVRPFLFLFLIYCPCIYVFPFPFKGMLVVILAEIVEVELLRCG